VVPVGAGVGRKDTVETTVVTTFAGVAEGVGLNDCEVVVAA
jgi:hypothetical protein